ncbi:hypothetical protein D3C72_1548340 [compost metagenome]
MLQRRFLGLGILDQIRDLPHLGIHPRADNEGFARPPRDHRAHEADIFLIPKRQLFGMNGFCMFGDRQ